MPTSKSLTLNEDSLLAEANAKIVELATLLKRCQDEGADTWGKLVDLAESRAGAYRKMLDELLAAIHRDGGQYTILVGHEFSVKDAMSIFYNLRRELEELRRAKSK